MTMKTCTKCGNTKGYNEFYGHPQTRDRLTADCKDCRREDVRRRDKERPDRHLRQNYKLTIEDYDRILEQQGGTCANRACGKTPGRMRFHVDHDHNCCPTLKTCGKCIRGLLCNSCNTALGHLRDDPDRMYGLVDYLNLYMRSN